jgi:hypothetical protein
MEYVSQAFVWLISQPAQTCDNYDSFVYWLDPGRTISTLCFIHLQVWRQLVEGGFCHVVSRGEFSCMSRHYQMFFPQVVSSEMSKPVSSFKLFLWW